MFSLWIICAVILLLYFYFYHFRWDSNTRRLINKIPGPKTFFLLGNMPQLFVKREDRFSNISKINGDFHAFPMIRLWLAWEPIISIHKAQAAEVILSSSQMIDKGFSYSYLHPWLGQGLLTSTGSKWHSRRKLLTPTFHFKILEEFFPIIVEQSQVLVDIIKRDINTQGHTLNIYPYLARCALDIICETAMGKSIKAQHDLHSPYVKAVNDMGEIFSERTMKPWLSYNWVFALSSLGRRQRKNLKMLHGFTNQVINERKREKIHAGNNLSEENGQDLGIKRRLAFLDLLLESNLNDNDIREEVDTFMFEGHDTTSSGINWVLYNVGKYPDVQVKLRQELIEVLHENYERQLNTEDLKQLKYLECVIKESMRLYPPVPFYGRVLKRNTEICGYTIPAGVEIGLSPYVIQRDPDYYTNPNNFEPERWLNKQGMNPFAYIPFSAGPRNCIGQKFALMEEKVVVAQILRNFWIQTSFSENEHPKLIAEFILRPDNGMNITFENKPLGNKSVSFSC